MPVWGSEMGRVQTLPGLTIALSSYLSHRSLTSFYVFSGRQSFLLGKLHERALRAFQVQLHHFVQPEPCDHEHWSICVSWAISKLPGNAVMQLAVLGCTCSSVPAELSSKTPFSSSFPPRPSILSGTPSLTQCLQMACLI